MVPNGVYKFKNNPHPLSNLPVGTILMWYNSAVPQGWARCDGKNGTPNLVLRVPIGSGGGIKEGTTGGGATRWTGTDLKLKLPGLQNSGNQSLENKPGGYMPWVHWQNQEINMPPYCGINFIMKLPLSKVDAKTGVPKDNLFSNGVIDGSYVLDRKVPLG